MPVKAVGNKIIEISTGKVRGVSKSPEMAARAARLRNAITEGGFVPKKRQGPRRSIDQTSSRG